MSSTTTVGDWSKSRALSKDDIVLVNIDSMTMGWRVSAIRDEMLPLVDASTKTDDSLEYLESVA